MTEQPNTIWSGFFPRLTSVLDRATTAIDDYTAAQFNPPLTHRLLEEGR